MTSREPTQPMDGRVIVVSGGTHGLGEATVRLLAERGAAGVAIVGRDRSKGAALAAELASAERARASSRRHGRCHGAGERDGRGRRRFGVVHGLVNVAAATWRGDVWNTDVDALGPDAGRQRACARSSCSRARPGSCAAKAWPARSSTSASVSGHGGQPFILAYCVVEGRAGDADQERRVLADAPQHPGQPGQPRLDGHGGRGRRAAAVPRRHGRLARSRRGRPADRAPDQAARGRPHDRVPARRRERDDDRHDHRLRPVGAGRRRAPKPTTEETPQ